MGKTQVSMHRNGNHEFDLIYLSPISHTIGLPVRPLLPRLQQRLLYINEGHIVVGRLARGSDSYEKGKEIWKVRYVFRNFYWGRLEQVLTHVYPVLFLSQIVTTGRLLPPQNPWAYARGYYLL